MKLHYLLTAVAASALMAGAAHAQLGAGTEPDAGVTPNQSAPADHKDAKTGLPSTDSTRPTGANAGQTNLPGGTIEPDTDTTAGATTTGSADVSASTTTGSTGATASTDTTGAASASGAAVAASTGGNVQVVSNGPVPDTAENRARYGGPMSRAGKRTAPAGN